MLRRGLKTIRDKRLLPRHPKSKFVLVECKGCGNTQIVFSHSSLRVLCESCKSVLVVPSGGKAKINGNVVMRYG